MRRGIRTWLKVTMSKFLSLGIKNVIGQVLNRNIFLHCFSVWKVLKNYCRSLKEIHPSTRSRSWLKNIVSIQRVPKDLSNISASSTCFTSRRTPAWGRGMTRTCLSRIGSTITTPTRRLCPWRRPRCSPSRGKNFFAWATTAQRRKKSLINLLSLIVHC